MRMLVIILPMMIWATLPEGLANSPQVPSEKKSESRLEPGKNPKPDESRPNKPVSQIPLTHTNIEKEETEDNAPQNSNETFEFWIIEGHRLKITDSLLVVFTFMLFVATLLLWRSTKKLVEGAEETAKRQLRAYVFLHDAKLAFTTMDAPFHIHIELRNSGQTPAHNVALWFKIDWSEYPLMSALSSEPGPGETVAPIAADTVVTRRLPTTGALTDTMREDLIAERKAIYVNGRVSYTDVFGDRYTTKINCLCTGEDLQLKRLRIATNGNEEIKG